jgi:putative transposase
MKRSSSRGLFELRSFSSASATREPIRVAPWQNGRIERFFGTLKDKLDRLAVDSLGALNMALGEFRFFYNHVRPHQNLSAAAPAEAWAGIDPFKVRIEEAYWFEAWEGLLRGYYMRR